MILSQVIQSDCLEVMQGMADNSIDFLVTDPPYGLKFMGKKWDYDIPKVEVWREALRICKPGSMAAVFGGSRTFHRLVVALEDAGWEIRDTIMWLYGSGFPKSHNFGRKLGGEWEGYGTALKPAFEPIIICMKPLDGTFAENAEKWNVAGINVDDCRIFTCEDLGRYNLKSNGISPFGVDDGSTIANGKSTFFGKPISEQGRWPANVILDEEAAAMLDKMSGLSKSLKSKKNDNLYKGNLWGSGDRSPFNSYNDSGGASRFFKCIESECCLCYIPCTKAMDKECKNTHVHNVNLNLKTIQETNLNFVPKNAQMTQKEQFVHNVKCAENLCDLCAINIVHALVEIKNLGFKKEELQATLDYIGSFKSYILIQNLVLFAEQWENIDIIPTIESLSKLFGCVLHAIESYTKQENHNQNGNNEQSRFRYCPKASTKERNEGTKGNFHPTIKPIALMKYILKLLAPPNNPTCLDPFCGSGTTLLAAYELGINCIGIEKEAEYCEIANKRLESIKKKDIQCSMKL